MATMFEYYRPHSTTLINEKTDLDRPAAEVGGHLQSGHTGQLVPARPCIVLDARGLARGLDESTMIIPFRDLVSKSVDESVLASDLGNKQFSDQRHHPENEVLRSMWAEILGLRSELRRTERRNDELKEEVNNLRRNEEQRRRREIDERRGGGGRRRRGGGYRKEASDEDIQMSRGRDEIMKKTLTLQTQQLNEYRDKVDQLENQLTKKNEKEKMSTKTTMETELQLKLKEKTKKMKELEHAYKKQELIVEEMERILEKNNRVNYDKREEDVIMWDENRRLRATIESLIENEKNKKKNEKLDEKEKLEKEKEKLEKEMRSEKRSEERIKSLEKQIAENAMKWSREKLDLTLQLQNYERRFINRHPSLEEFQPNLSNNNKNHNNWPLEFGIELPTLSRSARRKSQKLPSLYA